MAAGQPLTSPLPAQHSPPFSAPLPHCLIVTDAPPAFPVPFSSGPATRESLRILALTPACSSAASPTQGSALYELLKGLDVRAASPGREPCCSLLAKDRPASLCSDASRNRELPLSPSSPLRARTPSCFVEPSSAFRVCLRGSAAAPRPLCPQLFAGSKLTLSPLFSVLSSKLPRQPWAQVWGHCHRRDRGGRLRLSRGCLCPCTSLHVWVWDAAFCPAVLQGAQGRARVSPPESSCSVSVC